MAQLRANNLAKAHRGREVIQDVSLGLDSGQIVGLLGPNGAGKTTCFYMIIGISPGLGFSRAFGLLEGLSLSYNVSGGLFMHEATTSQRETPLISDCVNSSTGCESFLNMGVRNHRWRIINGFGLSLGIVPRLSVNLGTTVFTDFLYDSVEDERVSFTPQEVNNVRYAIIYSASVAWRPTDLVTLRLGSLSIGAQQKPDSTLRTPFFNRNTVLFFDLGFNLAGLMGGLSSGS